uniref:Uncharacterized protein n=1 Tax=Pithovirus LCPAC403 TaxID=2506596 RepID=A0A481ZBU2_9VIRU|nr:MAG: hypothetical protein LCPAC403_03910 [Pithovirus LCPAC403]
MNIKSFKMKCKCYKCKHKDLIVEISFDSTLAAVNQGAKQLFPPILPFIEYGDVIIIKGYIYSNGTWEKEPGCLDGNSMCGAQAGGGPTFNPIGQIVCTGTFFANPFSFFPQNQLPILGEEIGLFSLNLRFGTDTKNALELRGRTITGFDGSNPALFSVLGGTGIFKYAKGQALEIMIRPNNSGAFNFVIDLDGLRGVDKYQVKRLIRGCF